MISQVMHLCIAVLMIGVTSAQETLVRHWIFDENIDLQAFTDQGVNFANANSITHGLSSVKGGTDMRYINDIHLYTP